MMILLVLVLGAFMIGLSYAWRNLCRSLRDELGSTTDRLNNINNLYRELSKAHDVSVKKAAQDVRLAEQDGFNKARGEIFRESGEVRVSLGPLLSIDLFPGMDTTLAMDRNSSLKTFIERAKDDFLIEQYRAGYGIRSEVKTTMFRIDETTFTPGTPAVRFKFVAMGTPLVAMPDTNNPDVAWEIRRARIDTDSVGVRPQED